MALAAAATAANVNHFIYTLVNSRNERILYLFSIWCCLRVDVHPTRSIIQTNKTLISHKTIVHNFSKLILHHHICKCVSMCVLYMGVLLLPCGLEINGSFTQHQLTYNSVTLNGTNVRFNVYIMPTSALCAPIISGEENHTLVHTNTSILRCLHARSPKHITQRDAPARRQWEDMVCMAV